MIRNLLIISGVSLLVGVVGVAGSMAVGGADLARHSWTWVISDDDNGSLDIRRTEAPETITRTIAWVDTEQLTLSLPGKVVYIQDASAPAISVTGPASMVERVTFTDGQLLLASNGERDTAYVRWTANGLNGWSEDDALKVTINAASVKAFNVQGSTDLEVRAYNQDSLSLVMTGNADVKVQGRTNTLSIDGSGSSSAELDELLGRDATIKLSGNADVETAADGVVVIDASGSASVELTRRPSELRQSLSGDADVHQN